ncbi:MAG: B12-binding domain-containing radical SAM protein [Lachnospiraceae bacterium]
MKFLLAAINAKYIHSNPGVYSLKAYAEMHKQGGHDPYGDGLPRWHVEIGEYTINNQMEQILEDIYLRQPDVVGFSCYIWNVTYVLEMVRDLHKVLPHTDIWLGGPEVSFDAPDLLQREPEVLGVMKGEGETMFSRLLCAYQRQGGSCRALNGRPTDEFWQELAGIPGLTYRNGQNQIQDQPVQPVMDLSSIPFLYPSLDGFKHRIVYYESSRGCPFSCSYCLSSIDKSVRFRETRLVKQELQFFLEHRVPQVKFIDRTFNCSKRHAMEIWNYIKTHDNGVTNFHFEIAADLLDQEALQLIGGMRPGLIQLEIGVQSTNPDTLREIRRTMDIEQLKAVVDTLNQGHNVHQHLDLIAGLPYEDYGSFRNSFNEVYAMRPEQLQLGFLKVLKGSYMYDRAAEYGLQYRSLPPYEVLSTKWLPYHEVLRLKGVEQMVEVYYNSQQFTRTLALLEPEFTDAFALYEALAAHYEEQHLTGRSHSRLARYEILHGWLKGRLPAAQMAVLEDALMYDLYLRENSKSRPRFAPDQAPYKEQIRKLVPELRSLGTLIHVEVFQNGEMLVFDYREKDPLTNNAAVTRRKNDGKA